MMRVLSLYARSSLINFMKRALIIVAKQPLAGQVKTRIAATLGSMRAVELYRCALEDTLELAANYCSRNNIAPIISYAPPEEDARRYFRCLSPNAILLPQQGATFGARLINVIEETSGSGAEQMVMIGTDSPSLPPDSLNEAFLQLNQAETDVVLGRTADGGYYLIGMREPHRLLFERIRWSTAAVADETCERAAEGGLRLVEIKQWYDLDTTDDLRTLLDDSANWKEKRAPRTLAFIQSAERLFTEGCKGDCVG
jgi:hypothetical protein